MLLAFDLGGTTLRGAVADEECVPIAEAVDVAHHGGAPERLDQMAAMALRLAGLATKSLGNEAAIVACGLGLAAAVAPSSGRLRSVHNLPGLAGIDIGQQLERRLGMPVSVENDANLAALAEGRAGAAVGVRDYVFIAIGTGIGMGIVLEGRLRRGWRGMAGEVGFLPLGANPRTARARRTGAWESVASGPAIRRRIASTVASASSTTVPAGAPFAEVLDAAAAGDLVAAGIVEAEAALIARGIAAVVAIADPELVILGGGIGANPRLLVPVRRHVAALLALGPQIESSRLGDRATLVGALEAARSAGASG
jgi:glucokinase